MVIEVEPNTGRVLDWRFDEGSGETAHDFSGYNNRGLLNDSNVTNADGFTLPQWVEGKTGTALKFDGKDDYVHAADSPSLDVPNHIAIEVWINLDDTTGLTDQTYFSTKGVPYEMTHCPYVCRYYFNWYLGNGIASSSTRTECGPRVESGRGPLGRNEWTHLTFSYDGVSVKIYINGALVGDYTTTPANTPLQLNDEPLRLGARGSYHPSLFAGWQCRACGQPELQRGYRRGPCVRTSVHA